MPHKYVGKTCPYCKSEFKEDDVIVVCDTCAMPHHLSCWQDNAGCTTFGCTGMIKEMIGNPGAAPAGAQETKTEDARPSGEGSYAKPEYETIYESEDIQFQENTPVTVEKMSLILEKTKREVFARFTFRSLVEKPIKAILVDVLCKDVWGNDTQGIEGFQYLDLKTSRGALFGQNVDIKLPDSTARSVSVAVKKVMLEDGATFDCSPVVSTVPKPKTLEEYYGGNRDIADQYRRETSASAKYVLTEAGEYWICACGAVNDSYEGNCYSCGYKKESFVSLLSDPALDLRTNAYLEEKRISDEKEEADRQERIRLAEEQVRREKEEREIQRIIAEKKARKKKIIRKIAIALSSILICLVVLGIAAWFYGIPQYNYIMATKALEDERYDDAYDQFVALGDFKDSETMAMEALYQKAKDHMANGEYNEAIEIYNEIIDYSDSEDQINECTYQIALGYMEAKRYRNAIETFQKLPDGYGDSQAKINSCVIAWEKAILSSSSTGAATALKSMSVVNAAIYKEFYNEIHKEIVLHGTYDYWRGYEESNTINTLLNCLPSSYEDVSYLKMVFSEMANSTHIYGNLVRSNTSAIENLWDYSFIRDLATHDYSIAAFLEGDWQTLYGNYYITFYENENGGTNCNYNLPWVAQPAGTKYYNIVDCVYIYTDENMNELAKVFKFNIIDYDTMTVYCYKNGQTYWLYR